MIIQFITGQMEINEPPALFFLSVADLKHAIYSKYKIAIQHQVLVVNGGECMAAERRVCTYSAGTVGALSLSTQTSHLHAKVGGLEEVGSSASQRECGL